MIIGIIGLPSSGKTTVFNALTGSHKHTGGFSATATEPNVAVIKVPDPRMDLLGQMHPDKRVVLATVEYLDLVGVFSESSAHSKPGAASPLAVLRQADAIAIVIRAFADDSVAHPKGSIDPLRDLRFIQSELTLADLQVVEKRMDKLEKSVARGGMSQAEKEEFATLGVCKKALEEERPLSQAPLHEADRKRLAGFCLFADKPRIIVLNIGENQIGDESVSKPLVGAGDEVIALCAKLEMEIFELDEADRKDFIKDMGIGTPASEKLIQSSYRILNLASFFTIGKDEVRAWTIHRGDPAVTAAAKVHTDMARGFIRAEVVAFDDLKTLGSMKDVKAKGRLRLEGKDYVVKDGDVIQFRFSV
ncbi:MAG: redox-regulated ATPase YchF [Planctomycetes bacterium]|nr:redox-regulated ATPase YchF [Planctomycetota bacterium]MBM4081374.1 redox-regulated ATPase YchF [Planctomycetota bacterium]MBM4083237.1 redox-regulated ATPase YchF [Planctomycetota bacterium]